jgi:hypothetical protein
MFGRGGAGRMTRDAAEGIAVAALGFLAQDAERLGRFLSITGLGPENLREAARAPGFLGQVLSYLAEDERLLVEFAADSQTSPERVAGAHALLAGPRHEREDP